MHRERPLHAARFPSHVTLSFDRLAGSLRKELVFKRLKAILQRPKTEGFQVVQFSVQHTHLHLVVEAKNKQTFSSGMRSLAIRAALSILKLLGRKKGKVVRDRYHRRDLFSATQVRRALRYVLLNGQRHGVTMQGCVDPCSSGGTFDGWSEVYVPGRDDPNAMSQPPPRATATPVKPWTRLLASDWRALGLLSTWEGMQWLPDRDVAS
jgi:REP element-mobilizing transposase RayT